MAANTVPRYFRKPNLPAAPKLRPAGRSFVIGRVDHSCRLRAVADNNG